MLKNVNRIRRTQIFNAWLKALDDGLARKRIEVHIKRAKSGNFGDTASVGEGVFEIRLHFGPGYRLYYFQHGKQVYWLLMGGDKSTQASDVERAKVIKREFERGAP
jgi:putative addiction module killer protein